MTLLYHLKDLFTAYMPFMSYFFPFVAFSVFFAVIKILKMATNKG